MLNVFLFTSSRLPLSVPSFLFLPLLIHLIRGCVRHARGGASDQDQGGSTLQQYITPPAVLHISKIAKRTPSLPGGHGKANTVYTMRDWATLSKRISSHTPLQKTWQNGKSSYRCSARPANPHKPQETDHSVLEPHMSEEYVLHLTPKAC